MDQTIDEESKMTQMYDMFYDAAASNEKTGARSTSKWTKTTGTFGEATASNAGIGWDTSPTMGMSYAYAQQARWQCPWATRELIPRSGAHPSPTPGRYDSRRRPRPRGH